MGPSNCSHCLQCFSVFGIPSIFYSQEHIEGSFYIYLFLLHCCTVKLWKVFNKKKTLVEALPCVTCTPFCYVSPVLLIWAMLVNYFPNVNCAPSCLSHVVIKTLGHSGAYHFHISFPDLSLFVLCLSSIFVVIIIVYFWKTVSLTWFKFNV